MIQSFVTGVNEPGALQATHPALILDVVTSGHTPARDLPIRSYLMKGRKTGRHLSGILEQARTSIQASRREEGERPRRVTG